MKLQLALPAATNVERNVERKIDIEARGIRTREKSGLPGICEKMKAPHVVALTYNGGCRHIYGGHVLALCGRGGN